MKITGTSIAALTRLLTGDASASPYRTGRRLVRFFNEHGGTDDNYESGFPARWDYTETNIRQLNDSDALFDTIEAGLDPREFMDTSFSVEEAATELNQYLLYDGYEVARIANRYLVRNIQSDLVDFRMPFQDTNKASHIFIEDQTQKCNSKIIEDDFQGAITNARSLLEAVLLEVEHHLTNEPIAYDGDSTRLYRRIENAFELRPGSRLVLRLFAPCLRGTRDNSQRPRRHEEQDERRSPHRTFNF